MPTRDLPARFHRRIASLAVCFAISLLLLPSPAQETSTAPPGITPGAAVRTFRQEVEVTGVLVSYVPNRADVRLSDIGSSAYRQGYWMRILIQFTSQPNWADDVRLDCHILLRDGGNDNLLTGSVTCTDVQQGRGHQVCLYVPPNTLERYGGRARGVAVEGYYQNTVVSEYSMPRTTRRWWQDYTAVPDALVTWVHTPFLRDGIERYEQVRTQGRGF
jgi:hypothetical protein